MKLKLSLLVLALITLNSVPQYAQTCKDLYQEGNILVEQGKLEQAKVKFRQVIECGDGLYVPDSERRIAWIERILRKPDTVKPFSLSDTEVVIPYQGGQDVITVNGGGSWTAAVTDSGQSWCRIRKEKGKIYIISETNGESEDRVCGIEVRMGSRAKTVIVRNERAPELLRSSVENVTFPYGGETNTVEIQSNTDWEVGDVPGWLISSKEDGRIRLTALANDNNEERTAEIKIEGRSKTVIINISQVAGLGHLAFSKNDLHFGPEGGDEYINVYTDSPDWRLGDFPHWCQVTKVADNLLRVHCAPNEPIDVSREASVNVTTGLQTLGVNVSQDARPFVAVIPVSGIGGRAVSFGASFGGLLPMVSVSSGGRYTGSVVNYADGGSLEEVSYSSLKGLALGVYADIRVYRNLYLTTGLDLIHYGYKNEYSSDAVRNVIVPSDEFYLKGEILDNFLEDYSFSMLEVPMLASYRFPVTKISHVQVNVGPVISYGLFARLKFSGNSDGEKLTAYKKSRFGLTEEPALGIEADPYHVRTEGTLNLYGKSVSYKETYVEKNNSVVNKSQTFDSSPFRRLNLGLRLGVAYEYSGIQFGIDYGLMLTNMADKRYWEGNRWTVFNQPGDNLIAGYKQRNNYLRVRIGYTFRYGK